MKCLFFAFGLSLCATTALAAPVDYTFVFERQRSAVHLDPAEFGGTMPPFTAVRHDSPEYDPLFKVWLSHDGPLDGLTLDLADLEVEGFHDHWSTATGFLTFAGGTVAAWDAYDGAMQAGESWGFSWHHHSDARVPEAWFAASTLNPELIPAVHYGMSYTEPNSHMFHLLPGRWSCFIGGVSCGEMVAEAPPLHAPIPASLPLLLGGLAVLGWIGRRKTQS